MYHLVCIEDFGGYRKSDIITDQDEVARVLASPQHTHVVKINAPEPTKPAAPDLLGE